MNYLEIKDKFYQSEYATKIVDKWMLGIPFFMEYDNDVFDAFLFYSDNKTNFKFNSIKMLILLNSNSGEIINYTDSVISFNMKNEFSFTPKKFNQIEEYIVLTRKIEEIYMKLRDNYISHKVLDKNMQKEYLENINKMVSKELINEIYMKLSPKIFRL